MTLNEKLFEDPTTRSIIWCLLHDGQLSKERLEENGFDNMEALSILKDEHGHLRKLKRRMVAARALTPSKLAGMLRARISEIAEGLTKSSELSSLLRVMKSLPVWLFREWEEQAASKQAKDPRGILEQVTADTSG